jgi:AcrR family transcriptional regulator/predicted transcriptional regulator
MLGSGGVQRRDAGAPSRPAGVSNVVVVSETLRTRILSSAVALVGEVGYAGMSVERVVRLSGSSEETFYKCFDDLDACLLAAFEDAIGRIAAVVMPAYDGEREWPAKVRAAVAALLAILDDEPTMSMFVFVGALGAGPKVLACRKDSLERLKTAFEHGIDEAGMLDGSKIGQSSPLSAEGAVNAVLGILHTRLLEGSPLARRPLSELAGPLTAMIVLPYVGHMAASSELAPARSRSPEGTSNGAGAPAATKASSVPARAGSKVRPKGGARKRKRARLTPKQRAILTALKDGPLTVRELVDATGLSDQTARQSLNRLEARQKIVKTERAGRIAYELPSKAAKQKVAAGSSPSPESSRAPSAVEAESSGAGALAASTASNGQGSSNGAGAATSNGPGASNGHVRSVPTKAMLQALDPQISKREFEVLTAIEELNARGSSPSNREIGNATQIYDPTQLSKLIQRLAQVWLAQNTATGRHAYAWRVTSKGTELLRELEGQTVGGTHTADARV